MSALVPRYPRKLSQPNFGRSYPKNVVNGMYYPQKVGIAASQPSHRGTFYPNRRRNRFGAHQLFARNRANNLIRNPIPPNKIPQSSPNLKNNRAPQKKFLALPAPNNRQKNRKLFNRSTTTIDPFYSLPPAGLYPPIQPPSQNIPATIANIGFPESFPPQNFPPMNEPLLLPPKIRVIFIPTGNASILSCFNGISLPPFFSNRFSMGSSPFAIPPPLPPVDFLPLAKSIKQAFLSRYMNPSSISNWNQISFNNGILFNNQKQYNNGLLFNNLKPFNNFFLPKAQPVMTNFPTNLLPATSNLKRVINGIYRDSADRRSVQCRACPPAPPAAESSPNVYQAAQQWPQTQCPFCRSRLNFSNQQMQPSQNDRIPPLQNSTIQSTKSEPKFDHKQSYPYVNRSSFLNRWSHPVPPLPVDGILISDRISLQGGTQIRRTNNSRRNVGYQYQFKNPGLDRSMASLEFNEIESTSTFLNLDHDPIQDTVQNEKNLLIIDEEIDFVQYRKNQRETTEDIRFSDNQLDDDFSGMNEEYVSRSKHVVTVDDTDSFSTRSYNKQQMEKNYIIIREKLKKPKGAILIRPTSTKRESSQNSNGQHRTKSIIVRETPSRCSSTISTASTNSDVVIIIKGLNSIRQKSKKNVLLDVVSIEDFSPSK